MKAKLKYALAIQDELYPKDTCVDVLSATDNRILSIFPNIKENNNSSQIAILLPGRDRPVIHSVDALIYGE